MKLLKELSEANDKNISFETKVFVYIFEVSFVMVLLALDWIILITWLCHKVSIQVIRLYSREKDWRIISF